MTYGTVIGPDVSFYQDNNTTPQGIDFNQMKRAGADFVIIRAGQNAWVDPDFKQNWLAAKAAGLPRGSYWFYDSRATPISQAKLFVSLLAGDKPELGAWLDLEESYHGTYQGWANWKLCAEYLRMNLPRVGIYTAPYYWMTNRPPTGSDAYNFFKTFDLWIAHYNVTTPLIPGPWTSAVFWQYGTPPIGKQYGAESIEIDMNYFNGDKQLFCNYFDLPSQPPTGETMSQWYLVNTAALNIRSGPGSSYSDIGDLLKGEKIETTTAPVGGWYKIASVYHLDGTLQATTGEAWCSGAYLVPTLAPPVTPPPPVVETTDFTLTVAGHKPYTGKLEKA